MQVKHPNTMHAITLWSEGLSVAKTIPSTMEIGTEPTYPPFFGWVSNTKQWTDRKISVFGATLHVATTKVVEPLFFAHVTTMLCWMVGVGVFKLFLERHLMYIDATNSHFRASH